MAGPDLAVERLFLMVERMEEIEAGGAVANTKEGILSRLRYLT